MVSKKNYIHSVHRRYVEVIPAVSIKSNISGGIFIFECNLICETGRYHKKKNMANEDYASAAQNGQVAVIAIADGAGAMGNGGEAAKLVSEVLKDELLMCFSEYFFSDGETAKRRVSILVNNLLTSYSKEKSLDPQSLACTIMVTAMDTEGRCVCFHLGDGIILRQKKNQTTWDVVSAPRNGILSNTTYLTMNCSLWNNLQFYRWKDLDHKSMLLLTDGASSHLLDRSGPDGWHFIDKCRADINSIRSYLRSQMPIDDYTCGLISIK